MSGDHYRTRMTHSLEVAQISRTIARGLRLNEDLVEAIALGHDVGHTPFGHSGEAAMAEFCGHFAHNEQSLRVVDFLEREGAGLNLTDDVRDGIVHHTGKERAKTLEGRIVHHADRIAYLMEHPAMMKKVGDKAANTIARSWENVIEEVILRYRDIQKSYQLKQGIAV